MPEFPTFPPVYWAKQIPQQTALIWERGSSELFSFLPAELSWQQLHQLLSQTLAHLTARYGKLSDKTIAYCGSNRLAGLLCYLSVIAQNGRILMLNPAFTLELQRQILADCGVDFLLKDDDFADFSPNLAACQASFAENWDKFCPATLTLTSGSSGKPKAAVHHCAAHLLNAVGVCQLMQFEQQHSWLLCLPLFHVSGQGIVWRWLSQGATLRIYQDKTDFYPMLAKSSHASLVPTQLFRYLADLANLPKTTGQKILLGGAYIPPELIRDAKQAGMTTFAGYGMTELASTICAVENETDNVGKPLQGRKVKILDDQIWVKSDCLALGYWQKGEILPLPERDGYFATKDKGRLLANGNLVIEGRLDNMFISGGENIQPEQIEEVLYSSGLVQLVYIVPIADPEFGQRPVAMVEFLQPFNEQAVADLQNFAKSHLEKFKQPVAYYDLSEYAAVSSGIKISRQGLQIYLADISNRSKND